MHSRLKDKLQSQMKERQKLRKSSSATQGLIQSTADRSMAQVALLAVMQENTIEGKKQFDKQTLLAVAGNKHGINEVIHHYEADSWKDDEIESSHDKDYKGKIEGDHSRSKEEIIALKMAQQTLESEIRHEEELKERLKLSSIKQVYRLVMIVLIILGIIYACLLRRCS